MWQINETSPITHLSYGRTAVGVSPVQLTVVKRECNRGILIRAPGLGESNANTAMCYVGDSKVTVGTGMPIAPGGAIELPVDDPSVLFVVSDSANQSVAWMGM